MPYCDMCNDGSVEKLHLKTTKTVNFQLHLCACDACVLPLAAISDGRNHGDVLFRIEKSLQRAVPRVDQRELMEACNNIQHNSKIKISSACTRQKIKQY